MKINNFDNPIFIFLFCLFAILVNIISSIYFFPILLFGTLFIAFYICLNKKYYYSLSFVILTIILLELNNGFKPLSVVLLIIFIYTFIAPYIKRVLSFHTLNPYLYMTTFYIGLYLLWLINNNITMHLNYTILINIIIDFIIFGVFV